MAIHGCDSSAERYVDHCSLPVDQAVEKADSPV